MKVSKDFELEFNKDKTESLIDELISVYQKHKPTVGEIIISLSNLTYTLGAGIGGFSGKGPGVDELKRLYYLEPGRLDISMMLQAMTMASWYEDWRGKVLEPDTKDKEGTINDESTSIPDLQGDGGQ